MKDGPADGKRTFEVWRSVTGSSSCASSLSPHDKPSIHTANKQNPQPPPPPTQKTDHSPAHLRSPVGRERRERQALHELRLPREPSRCFGIVDPLPPALLALQPVRVEALHVELVEVVR